ncbi:MAG: glycosyltransferase [Cellulomonas sp.]|uniref:glycosyltransferase family 2 protein n=1 Tax=Cellulomonas sp. 73-92 TaxID=1895740 RepID=UPI000929135C|nr:glycosyltransferase [Cellulomonas sp. 73-92]MBN9376552.1 glycosyltransferase [Cellulomonas sp.]OJV82137.1 MAG: glycosyl transferase family 2 [Cellulomonas sp. 73-92]
MKAPLVSILTPVYDPPVSALQAAIASVRSQTFTEWELVLVDDASRSPDVRAALARATASDPRIRSITRATNGGIVAASNDALAAARGEFVALLDHDDLLTRDALASVVAAVRREPDTDYLYSDEDKVDAQGHFYDAFHKPDWSPERLRGQMYTAHLSVLRTGLVREVGGFAAGSDGSQDHDLVLRVTERARHIVHVPKVLYHWRSVAGSTAGGIDAKPYAWEAGRAAVQRHLDRCAIAGEALLGPVPGTYRVRRSLSPETSVSVVVPTRGGRGRVWGEARCFVVEMVRSVLSHTEHENLEIVVVYDEDTPASVLGSLRTVAGSRLTLVPFREPFNFSAKCNVGFLASQGDVVVFMNDDMQVVTDRFIEELVAPLAEPGVGAAGARLLFADGSLQHGGHVYAEGDLTHAGFRAAGDSYGPFSAFLVNRECSGLTAACLAVSRSVVDDVGGFCEDLPGNFNDVDLSNKIRFRGLRLVWLADVTAYHFESQTRDPQVEPWEYDFIMRRWASPRRDPYLPDEIPSRRR